MPVGHLIDLVASLVDFSGGVPIFCGLWHDEPFIVKGWTWGVGSRWTLYGFRKAQCESGYLCLEALSDSVARKHTPICSASFRSLIDLCSGMGGFSLGAQAAQVNTVLFVDKSPLACEAVRANQGSAYCGDLMNRSDRIHIHLQGPSHPVLLSAGFPCQPYSRHGNALAAEDPRSQVLGGVLRLAWHMQAAGLVLECVAEVAQCREAIQTIQGFAAKMNFDMQTVVLDLQDQWAACRRRWWALLLPVRTLLPFNHGPGRNPFVLFRRSSLNGPCGPLVMKRACN